MKSNTDPTRRRVARAKIGVSPGAMARWSLLKIISDGMKPIGEYSRATLSNYRNACRLFQRFIGYEQSAVNVTEAKFDKFRKWLEAEGYHESTVELNIECLAAVVRFADRSLLPSREIPERQLYADATVEGTIEYFLLNEFFPVQGRIDSEATRRHYGFSVAKLSGFLGHPATLADLNDATFAKWVAEMTDSRLTTRTINGYIHNLRGFWKWAVNRGMLDTRPTIKPVRDCDRSPLPEPHIEANLQREPRRVRRGSPAERKGERDLGAPNSILRFVDRYLAVREVSDEYRYILRTIAGKFAKHIGRASLDDLFAEDPVNAFLASLNGSPYTIRGYRSLLVTLWNAAADEDLVPYPRTRRLRRPKCPEIVIECYSVDEVRRLLAATEQMKGEYGNGVTKRLYWRAAILLAWDTGLRRGDLWRFRTTDVREDGAVRLVQHKTRQIVSVKLRPVTINAIGAIHYDQPLKWGMDKTFFGRHFQRLKSAAGIDRGSFKWIRRSSGSYVEIQQPGAGHKHLGHSNPAVFNRHYDAKLGGHTLPQPPDLGEGGEGAA